MPTETQEHQHTVNALTQIWNFVAAGGYEYVNFVMARVTDNVVGSSFLGSCTMTQPTPTGARGTLKSFSDPSRGWISKANVLGLGPTVSEVELEVLIDLNSGIVNCKWTPPGGTPQHTHFKVEWQSTGATDMGTNYRFYSDSSSDHTLYLINILTN